MIRRYFRALEEAMDSDEVGKAVAAMLLATVSVLAPLVLIVVGIIVLIAWMGWIGVAASIVAIGWAGTLLYRYVTSEED